MNGREQRTVVTKRTVSGDVDVVFLTVFDQFRLLEERVSLDLVGDLILLVIRFYAYAKA